VTWLDLHADVAIFDWLTMVKCSVDMWHLIVEWKGATWPNQGLPRGTHLQVIGFIFGSLKFLWSAGFDPGTSSHNKEPYHMPPNHWAMTYAL